MAYIDVYTLAYGVPSSAMSFEFLYDRYLSSELGRYRNRESFSFKIAVNHTSVGLISYVRQANGEIHYGMTIVDMQPGARNSGGIFQDISQYTSQIVRVMFYVVAIFN
jgi:hypothetical protein